MLEPFTVSRLKRTVTTAVNSVHAHLPYCAIMSTSARVPSIFLMAALLFSVFSYLYALDSKNAPTIPDEGVYQQIARVTAASGHWLPLRSELPFTRNTKPPMLFWQGMVSTHWGTSWDRFSLRYPSVIYTMGTAAMLFLLGLKLGGSIRSGLISALTFLAFYNTYRYGRPFLTSAAEVFWYFLPFFVLLYWGRTAVSSRVWVPLVLGVALGIGLLYKSFTLLAPVGFAVSLWYLHDRSYNYKEFLRLDALKVLILALVSLAVFGLWFLMDPDPDAIVREFVLGENAGKFNAGDQGYFRQLIWGGQSIPSLVLAVFSNVGVFAPVLLGLLWVTISKHTRLSREEKLLWVLFLAFFLVFSLPSVRSGRYLLPVMPAIALLIALRWDSIPRGFFMASLLLVSLVLSVISWLSFHLHQEAPETVVYAVLYWPLIAISFAVILIALTRSAFSRDLTPVVSIMAVLVLACFLRLLDGPMGQFSLEAIREVQSQPKTLGVPIDFIAKDESYRFEFPGAQIKPYEQNAGLTRRELALQYPYFIVNALSEDGGCLTCRILSQRYVVRSMQPSEEIHNSLRDGKLFNLLIGRQLLIVSNPSTP